MEKWRQLTKEAYVLINSWPLSARQHTWCNEPNTTQNTTGMSYCSWLMTNAFTDSTGWVPNLWDKHVRKTHTSCQNIHFCHYMYNLQPNLSTTLAYSTQQKIIVLIDMHNTHTHTHTRILQWICCKWNTLAISHTQIQWSDFPMHHHFQGQSCSCEVTTVLMVASSHSQTSLITNEHNVPALIDGRFKHSISLSNKFCNLL